MKLSNKHLLNFLFVPLIFFSQESFSAGNLNPAADISKIKTLQEEELIPHDDEDKNAEIPDPEEEFQGAPEGFSEIKVKLKSVKVTGSTIYSDAELATTYEEYLGNVITLDKLWLIAERITKKYREDGYFLSKAYVPEQEMDVDANPEIKIYEAGIGEVTIAPELLKKSFIKNSVDQISNQTPINSKLLETRLLRLNDIPGLSFRSVLQKKEGEGENKSQLVLVQQEEKPKTMVRYDNSGSRFMGPNKLIFSHEGVYIPYVRTTISALTTVPVDEVNYLYVSNYTPITYDTFIDVYGSLSRARPGYTLAPQEVRSSSKIWGVNLIKKIIRSRDENLNANIGFEYADSTTNVLKSTLLSEDNVRKLKLGLDYENENFVYGDNSASATITQGLDVLGATDKNFADASRSRTQPDFLKFEANYNYKRNILKDNVGLIFGLKGQYSEDSLYSSEEFGYGGSNYGRAYDESQFSGDSGINSSIEINYLKVKPIKKLSVMPYTFYDAGKVWNNNSGQNKEAFAASYGLGVRGFYKQTTVNVGISAPLAQKITTPIYENEDRFRFIFGVSYNY